MPSCEHMVAAASESIFRSAVLKTYLTALFNNFSYSAIDVPPLITDELVAVFIF